MEPNRKFKIIVNSKECGTCSGPTPSAVAKKVVKKLCGSSSKVVKFRLKECKRGCERVCGPYQGRMEKLDRPYKRDGKTITHRVVCGKVRKMRGGEQKLVLILCHNKKVTGTFSPDYRLDNHFYGICGIYKALFEEYNLEGEPTFETIDIIPGGTYTQNAFSNDFIDRHREYYDLVMVPDCGGEWFEYQSPNIQNKTKGLFSPVIPLSNDDQNKRKTELIKLSLKLTKVVKKGGIIQFSKFQNETPCIIEEIHFNTFSEALNTYLNENGFRSIIKMIKEVAEKNIIAIKL